MNVRRVQSCPSCDQDFADRATEEFWRTGKSSRLPPNIRRAAARKLLQLDAAKRAEDMRVPPGNHLEALRGDREGQLSIRINRQFRICFTWKEGDAYGVEVTDYH